MTVAVAMSGGVDSSAAACLLLREGHTVFGATLNLWINNGLDGKPHSCCRPEDVEDARRVASHIGIPHYVLDYTAVFKEFVVDRFAADYASGRTPSPCIPCNTHIKFGRLLKEVCAIGADRLATGHYARIVGRSEDIRLARAIDRRKDQSYFLFELEREQLAKILFPLGELTKEHARQILRDAGLTIHDKQESQEICFVGSGDYVSFLERHYGLGHEAGAIIGPDGGVIGEHRGTQYFTIGQRRGLGVSGPRPYYVTSIDRKKREVRIGHKEDTYKRAFLAKDMMWTGKSPQDGDYLVQIRSRHTPAPAAVHSDIAGVARVEFHAKQSAITPGQAAVFYRDDVIEGGGWISEVL